MKYVTVLTIRDLFTKVSSPLGSCAYRCAGSSPVTRTKQQRVSIQNSIDTLCSYIQQMNILSLIMYSFAINSKTVSQSKNFN